jgi:hypothetical protein
MTALLKILIGGVALALAASALAVAHGDSGARADQPSFNRSTLRLSAAGGYGATRRHAAIRVTVCLEKRYRGSFFTVKCKSQSDGDRRVRARVGVAGCVRGVWRTAASGEALGRDGNWGHAASAQSAPFRCGG